MKKLLFIFISILLICTGCGKEKLENPIVTMTIKDYGDVIMELYPEVAYNTVANFVTLIENGFYDNNTIHRFAKDFVLQGGDPDANGTGGPGYSIKGEFALNGVDNGISHTRGILSMARSEDYNSAGSQFFIVLNDRAKISLDGKYAAFGKVIEGMDVIEKIEQANLEVTDSSSGKLKNPLIIEKVTVDTQNHEYVVEKYKN